LLAKPHLDTVGLPANFDTLRKRKKRNYGGSVDSYGVEGGQLGVMAFILFCLE